MRPISMSTSRQRSAICSPCLFLVTHQVCDPSARLFHRADRLHGILRDELVPDRSLEDRGEQTPVTVHRSGLTIASELDEDGVDVLGGDLIESLLAESLHDAR